MKRHMYSIQKFRKEAGLDRDPADRFIKGQNSQVLAIYEKLLDVRETERLSVARDLHDTVSQTLGMGITRLKTLMEKVPSGLSQDLNEILNLLEITNRDLMGIACRATPPILQDADLDTALNWLVETMTQTHPVTIDTINRIPAGACLGRDVREILFRGVRELINNVIRHSGDDRAVLVIETSGGRLKVSVIDQGLGFATDSGTSESSLGFGLFSLSERLRLIGGELVIESEPDKGTCVAMVLPVADE